MMVGLRKYHVGFAPQDILRSELFLKGDVLKSCVAQGEFPDRHTPPASIQRSMASALRQLIAWSVEARTFFLEGEYGGAESKVGFQQA